MKRRKLIKHLEYHGVVFDKHGANHDKYRNTATGKKTTISRHNELDDDYAKEVCKQLGIPKP